MEVDHFKLSYDGEKRICSSRNVTEIESTMWYGRITGQRHIYDKRYFFLSLLPFTIFSVFFLSYHLVNSRFPSVQGFGAMFLACVASALTGVLAIFYQRRTVKVNMVYCPHMVSSVLADYDRGTTREVAMASIS